MAEGAHWQLLADVVLLAHCALVLFVIGGAVLIVAGNRCGWAWVNRAWFRLTHLAVIVIVVAEAWSGITCPLTTLENALRTRAGMAGYATSFIEHWLQRLLYYDAPAWVFVAAYSVFAALVLGAWWRYPPHWPRRRR